MTLPLQQLSSVSIHRVTRLDLIADDWRWPFAETRREDIAAHFARLRAAQPALWNGRVLLAREPQFAGESLSARYFQTDFASFIAWRDWGFPDPSAFNGFGMGALRGSDDGFVLGEMSAQTANAGKVYFPSGTPDLSDLRDGRVDIAASIAREVAEETGFTADEYRAAAQWDCVVAGQRIAMIRVLDVPYPSEAIRERIAAFIARQNTPELNAAHVARTLNDISPAMPDFIVAFLSARFA